jgi:putative tRNA adenosine deaminase-associated protein
VSALTLERNQKDHRCDSGDPRLVSDRYSACDEQRLRQQPVCEGGYGSAWLRGGRFHEFFLIARAHGPRIDLLLSDLTAAVEFPLAAQALERLGEDPPEEDELDEVWPIGELDLFSDLRLGEEEMEAILDDMDAYPDEMLDTVIERIGLEAQFNQARSSGRVGR